MTEADKLTMSGISFNVESVNLIFRFRRECVVEELNLLLLPELTSYFQKKRVLILKQFNEPD